MFIAALSDRVVLKISGDDASTFLQGIITNDMVHLNRDPIMFAAMLSPQGKLQHDFFVLREKKHFLLDVAADHVDALLKKLKLYKLRSKVDISNITATLRVAAAWGPGISHAVINEFAISHLDPRLHGLGLRLHYPPAAGNPIQGAKPVTPEAYAAHVIAMGVPANINPDATKQLVLELGYDQLGAVSFSKGCYIGQEVTARMHYRHVLRRCPFMLQSVGGAPIPAAGTPITRNGMDVGEVQSCTGAAGVGILKLRDVFISFDESTIVQAAGVDLHAALPTYMKNKVEEVLAAPPAAEV